MKVNYQLEGSLKSATRWLPAALLVAGLALMCWPQLSTWYPGSGTKPSATNTQPIEVSPSSRSAGAQPRDTAKTAGKLPIESLRVGDRVLAVNPEVTPEERAAFVEPNWHEWLQLSLSMPKGDGSLLTIELLRPESWVRSQTGVIAKPNEAVAVTELASSEELSTSQSVSAVPLSPLRPIYRELAEIDAELELSGEQLHALFVDMDLPELAITGAAVVHDIRNAPLIAPGGGRVVTATFKHSSGDVIDLVISDGVTSITPRSPESIGTTSNHPFWSVDRQEYVQAGQLELGERVQTYSGDTKRVLAILPRPGPEAVYNLEVFAEHVYYVGEDGVLVHNAQQYLKDVIGGTGTQALRDWWDNSTYKQIASDLGQSREHRNAVMNAFRRLRRGGGDHEYYMVSNLLTMKSWGVSSEQLIGMQQSIKELNKKMNYFTHGNSRGSSLGTEFHEMLDGFVNSSNSLREFGVKVRRWAQSAQGLKQGISDLPEIFHDLDRMNTH